MSNPTYREKPMEVALPLGMTNRESVGETAMGNSLPRWFVPGEEGYSSSYVNPIGVTEEHFEFPKDFDLDAFMRHGFKRMHDELHTVKVRISPEWARWVGEEHWEESQNVCLLMVRPFDDCGRARCT
jgi:hypothetical protein